MLSYADSSAGVGTLSAIPSRARVRAGKSGLALGTWSVWIAAISGFFTAFTVSVVGEMPVGELVLLGVLSWMMVAAALRGEWRNRFVADRWLWILMGAQALACLGYIVADVGRESALRDVARGWGRMGFLALDLVAVAAIFGCRPWNWLWLIGGALAGDAVQAWWFGPLFGEMWKFGVGVPLTFGAVALAALAGPWAVAGVAGVMGVVHFGLDYRSFGGLCFGLSAAAVLQAFRPRARLWLAPMGLACAGGVVLLVYGLMSGDANRGERSNLSRGAMMVAAVEAFADSPLLGQGSWFSNSRVPDEYLLIRAEAAREAGIGGLTVVNGEGGEVAVHSQLLVGLAEGGILGGAFFIAYGVMLVVTLGRLILRWRWTGMDAVAVLFLLSAGWALIFSPFSGEHRVSIAVAVGVMILLRRRGREVRT